MSDQKTLPEILSSFEDLKTVKIGYLILVKINEIVTQNGHINPTGLAEIFHVDELAEYNNNKRERQRKLKNKSDAISRKCRCLEKLGLIEEQKVIGQRDEKIKNLILTKKGKELLKYYPLSVIKSLHDNLKQISPKTDVKEKISDYHNERIRDQISRIIDGFPEVYDYFVSLDSFEGFQMIYTGGKLPFEDDILFSDLVNHLGPGFSFIELQKRIDEFKMKAAKLPDVRIEAKEMIQKELQTNLGLEYDPNCSKINTFSSDLVEWVFQGIVQSIESNGSKEYHNLFVTKEFEFESSPEGLIIRSGVYPLMKVYKETRDRNVSMIRDFMSNIGVTGSYHSVNNFIEYRTSLKQLRDLIINKLKHEAERTSFSGPCLYS